MKCPECRNNAAGDHTLEEDESGEALSDRDDLMRVHRLA